jgi:DNA-binding SARP family transcriptional activator
MWQEALTNLSFDQFHRQIKDKRLVIVYPKTTYHNLFLSYFLRDTSLSLHYYRLRSNENTIPLVIHGLLGEWDNFGKLLYDMLDNCTAQELAFAFAKEFDKIKNPALIYLDEIDHLTASTDCNDFFSTLVKNLPKHCQLVINARSLSIDPWKACILAGDAVVLGNEFRSNDLMFSKENADKPQLEVQGFGSGHATINGIEIDQWDGALPRNLFFYFIDKPLVTRDEIFEIFWPNLKIKEATNVYHVTKRKITEKISRNIDGNTDYELTSYSGGFYRPANEMARYYDVAQFEADIEQASMTFNDEAQATLYRRAIELYKAPFLNSVDMPWVRERRERLQRQFLEASIGLARIYKAANRNEEALGYFVRALRENPFREDLHREVMQLYLKMNYPQEAINHYHIMSEMLKESLGVAPAPESQTLFAQIKA